MIQKVVFVLVPALALFLSAPIVTEVLPYELETGEYHWQFWLIGAAAGAGLLAAPGYLLTVFRPLRTRESPLMRWWELVSLAVGLIASAIGTAWTIFAFWPLAVLPIGAALMCVWLLLRLSRSESNAVRGIATNASP